MKKSIRTSEVQLMMDVVGGNIKHHRCELGLSQQQVADYLNINRTTYTKYEAGVTPIGYYIIIKLASLFNTDFNDLLCYEAVQYELSRNSKQNNTSQK